MHMTGQHQATRDSRNSRTARRRCKVSKESRTNPGWLYPNMLVVGANRPNPCHSTHCSPTPTHTVTTLEVRKVNARFLCAMRSLHNHHAENVTSVYRRTHPWCVKRGSDTRSRIEIRIELLAGPGALPSGHRRAFFHFFSFPPACKAPQSTMDRRPRTDANLLRAKKGRNAANPEPTTLPMRYRPPPRICG